MYNQFGNINPNQRNKDGEDNNSSTNNENNHPVPFNFSNAANDGPHSELQDKNKPSVNQAYITGNIGETIISIPLIYPPPKVESKQIKQVEKSEKSSNKKSSNHDSSSTDGNSEHNDENELLNKSIEPAPEEKEIVSKIETDPNIIEEKQALMEEPSSLEGSPSTSPEEPPSLEDEFFLMLVGDTEGFSDTLTKHSLMDMTPSSVEVEDSAMEESDNLEDEISSLLEESSSIEEDSPYFQEEESIENSHHLFNEESINDTLEESSSYYVSKERSLSIGEESSSVQDESSSSSADCMEYDFSFIDEEQCSKNVSKDEKEPLLSEEESEEWTPFQPKEKDPNDITVKLTVLLSQLTVTIDIFKTIELCMPIENISKVEWSLQSLDCKVLGPKVVFLKGILVADVEIIKTEKLQSLKIPIPWSKTVKPNWLHPPDLPSKSQKEFIFAEHKSGEMSSHVEFNEKLSTPINSQVQKIHFTFQEDFYGQEENAQIGVHGSVFVIIDLLQEQFISIKGKGSIIKGD